MPVQDEVAPVLSGAGAGDTRPAARRPQQAAAVGRKRPAEGLKNELVGLDAIAGWDPEKLRNLEAFFNRMPSTAGRHTNVAAPKRQRMEWAAGAATATAPFRVGHNNPRPGATASSGGNSGGGGGGAPGSRPAAPAPW